MVFHISNPLHEIRKGTYQSEAFQLSSSKSIKYAHILLQPQSMHAKLMPLNESFEYDFSLPLFRLRTTSDRKKKILSYWPAWKTNTWISFIFKSSKIFQLQIAVTIAVIIRVILHMAFSLLLEEMYFPIYVCCEKVVRMTACMLNLVFIKCQLES